MLAQWIGELIGQMHNNKISKTQLAEHMGVSREYVSMVINGHREPAGAQERFNTAVREIIAERQTADTMDSVPTN